MKDEIKEILDNLRFSYEQNKELYEKYNQDVMRYIIHLKEAELLLDYITNLQEKIDDLESRLENAVADCNLRLQEIKTLYRYTPEKGFELAGGDE